MVILDYSFEGERNKRGTVAYYPRVFSEKDVIINKDFRKLKHEIGIVVHVPTTFCVCGTNICDLV